MYVRCLLYDIYYFVTLCLHIYIGIIPFDERIISSCRISQHSAQLLTATTSGISYPTSLRFSSLGRSQDDDEGAIHYPPNLGQHRSLPRQTPAAGSVERFHSAEYQYYMVFPTQPETRIMVSVKSSPR